MTTLDQAIEDIEDGVAAPCVGIVTHELSVFGGRVGASDAVSITAEGFELVDEFIYDIPCPVILFNPLSDLSDHVQNKNIRLTVGTSRSTGPSELSMK